MAWLPGGSPEAKRKARTIAVAGLAGLVLAGAWALLAPAWYTGRLSVVSLKRSGGGLGAQAAELRELGVQLPGSGGDAERVAAVLSSESVSGAVGVRIMKPSRTRTVCLVTHARFPIGEPRAERAARAAAD